jgi:hypothetical protein
MDRVCAKGKVLTSSENCFVECYSADIANVTFLIWGLKVNAVPCPKEEGSTKKKSFLKREGAQLGLGFLK